MSHFGILILHLTKVPSKLLVSNFDNHVLFTVESHHTLIKVSIKVLDYFSHMNLNNITRTCTKNFISCTNVTVFNNFLDTFK